MTHNSHASDIFMSNAGMLVQVKIPVFFLRNIIKWGSDKGLRVCFSGAAKCEGWGGVCEAGKQAHSALGADECLFSQELLVIKSRETVLLWGQLLCSPFLSNQWTPPSSSLLQQDRFLIIASPSSLCIERISFLNIVTVKPLNLRQCLICHH